jgi:hypothetical protein
MMVASATTSEECLPRYRVLIHPAAAGLTVVCFLAFSDVERRAEIGYLSLLQFLALVALLGGPFAYAALFMNSILNRRFASSLAYAASAAIVLGSIVSLPTLTAGADAAIDEAQLGLWQSHYETRVAELTKHQQSPRTVALPWGAGGGFAIGIFYTLVDDESGEIALPPGQRSRAWEEKVLPQDRMIVTGECPSWARRLQGNFYSVMTLCQ